MGKAARTRLGKPKCQIVDGHWDPGLCEEEGTDGVQASWEGKT